MKSKFCTVVLLLNLLASNSANALDIPVLTWEQGKAQSVVLGGPTASENWQVELISENSKSRILFRSSRLNDAGFRVFSVDIPQNLPEGDYKIQASGVRSAKNIVAQVVIVEQRVFELPRAPYNLLLILLILSYLSVSISSMKSQSSRFFSVKDFTSDLRNFKDGSNLITDSDLRVATSSLLRLKIASIIQPGLLLFLTDADSSWLYKRSKFLFSYLHFVGALIAVTLFFTPINHSDVSPISLLIFTLLVILGILDKLTGILSAFTFILMTILFTGTFEFRILLSAIIIASVFILPSIFVSLSALHIDSKKIRFNYRALHWFISAHLFFFLSLLLLQSVNEIKNLYNLAGAISILLIAMISWWKIHELRGLVIERDLESNRDIQGNFRFSYEHNSKFASFVFFVFVFLFYIWTESFQTAFFASSLWTLPILIVSFNRGFGAIRSLARVPRSITMEALGVLFLGITIFEWVQQCPLLVQDRANLILFMMAVPVVLHSLVVTLVESSKGSKEVRQ